MQRFFKVLNVVYSLTRLVWVLRQTQTATAAVPHPVKQGLIQSLGVFFDTMLVCTATAIMILLYSGLKFGENALKVFKLHNQH